jgi:hypothetical protein
MANLLKLKRRLPAPPTEDETTNALREPETAPAPAAPVSSAGARIDGRSLRKTGRTVQFATRVSPGFDQRFRVCAKREGLMFAELLEQMLETFERRSGAGPSGPEDTKR